MSKSLVIVESPAKSKTIKKYLGEGFEVMASYGHIRDLEAKNGAVDPDNNFKLSYTISDSKHEEQFNKIRIAVKKVDHLYLATDPDREGEAIAWHLYELLVEKGAIKNQTVSRVVFHEITKRAIVDAVQNPREIAIDLVHAQLARRALDHLIGFKLSPVLWEKIRIRKLSAGRVQSPALRLIVERELEINAFDPREYWSIEADLNTKGQKFKGKLTFLDGDKISQFSINNEKDAFAAQKKLTKAANGILTIEKIEKKKRKRNPAPPFITSTLQQEASRKLGFSAQRTMIVAQQLYEGIEIDGEGVGLISYMRTDSVVLAQEALEEIREVIKEKYGANNLPSESRSFKNKTKNAQEAHEAIRPTSAKREPSHLKKALARDQFRLYELIWKRTIACQMIHATIDTVSIDLSADTPKNMFRANGSTIAIPGFMEVYQESFEEGDKKSKVNDDNKGLLPPMKEKQQIELLQIRPEQHFTEPPPRFSEASLVKALEEHGIGRPSTYAPILQTLQARDYTKLEKKRFHPTMVGRMVHKFLKEHFAKYIDYDFTAKLEEELNEISRGEREWIPVMKQFWEPLKALIDEKLETITDVTLDETCPKCSTALTIKSGKNGLFIGCTAYPDCNYTRNANHSEHQENETQVLEGQQCPKCDSNLIIKQGPYGKFVGCSGYPDCRYLKPILEPEDETGVKCPTCKKGDMLKRRSKKGKIFFSCSSYPDCKYAVWNKPVNDPCPQCEWPMLTIKTTKKSGSKKVCEECKYSEHYDPPEESENENDNENQQTS
ncbi:DNA topoisomerase I [hydrothermal vent metagenome]|uniref:DNA topoisomerase n=1 Tax=hydrothermal vent metagenome TaxID=652676 RepID=A0A3B0ZJ12_9ZZZZ